MMMERRRLAAGSPIFYRYWFAFNSSLLLQYYLLMSCLQEVNNVLVVVTRYFGGIHLGPDRFKHINQAARNALELGGFLDAVDTKRNTGRGKKH